MINPCDLIETIDINSMSDFISENFTQYKNLQNLNLYNIVLEDFIIIEELLEKLPIVKRINCEIKLSDLKNIHVEITRINEEIHLYFNILGSIDEVFFFKKLPNFINFIHLNHQVYTVNYMLDDLFTNLPVNLKKIEINYTVYDNLSIYKSVFNLEKNGAFNYLFYAKLPFGCEIVIHILYNTVMYTLNVIYENNKEKQLTLSEIDIIDSERKVMNEKNIIKKNIIITYFTNNNFDDYNVLRIMSGLGGLAYSS